LLPSVVNTARLELLDDVLLVALLDVDPQRVHHLGGGATLLVPRGQRVLGDLQVRVVVVKIGHLRASRLGPLPLVGPGDGVVVRWAVSGELFRLQRESLPIDA
jgi:hypothetical protein